VIGKSPVKSKQTIKREAQARNPQYVMPWRTSICFELSCYEVSGMTVVYLTRRNTNVELAERTAECFST